MDVNNKTTLGNVKYVLLEGAPGHPTDQQVATAVSDWLNTNVDPVGSAVVVDSSLSIEGAAADAKTTGEAVLQLLTLTTKTLAQIQKYNAYDIGSTEFTNSTGTSNGVTFTYNELYNRYTVSGSTVGAASAALRIMVNSLPFPDEIYVGKKLYVKYNTTDEKVRLRLMWLGSGGTIIRLDYFAGNGDVTVPENAVSWQVALVVLTGQTISPDATVSEFAVLTAPTNEDLAQMINGGLTRSKGNSNITSEYPENEK